jgi:hypothetical protein
MSVASEFPPDVYIPAAARRAPRGSLRIASAGVASSGVAVAPRALHPGLTGPAAPAAAALGAGVIDLDRWRHQFVGAQAGEWRRLGEGPAAGLRARPIRLNRSLPVAASTPIRLTRRGLALLAVASVVLAVAVVVMAWLSAGSSASGASATSGSQAGPAVVTVHRGDSLWAIATTVAPNRDPRVVVVELQKLNHLADETVTPGQQLRVR